MNETQKLNGNTTDVVKTSDEIKQDASSKQVMKDRYFLANILKSVIPEYKDVSEYDIAFKYIEPSSIKDNVPVSKNLTNQTSIIGSSEEDSSVNEGIIKYDVIFEATAPVEAPDIKYKHKKKNKMIQVNLKIDVEAQNNYDPGYPISKRAMFYCARMLSAEFNGKVETAEYNSLYKVYSIWICFEPPQYAANTISRFKVVKEDVYGELTIPEIDYNLMESVIIRLGKEEDAPNTRIFELLYALFGTRPGNEKLEQLQELGYAGTSLEKEVKDMISFSERTKQIGYNKGMQQGMQQATYDMIIKMYKKGMSVKQIADITDITVDDINKMIIDK
ncbi:helix-turn-helix domain-containing protein [Hungatella hathewayi]|uniref:helix-turn-helix domain-containing protein n=1 Tax=Hungatella hathewayi TaxID=154046 RepID=UPI003569B84A